MMKVLDILDNIFLRRHIFQTNVLSGTTRWSEVLQALRGIVKDEIVDGPDILAYEKDFSKIVGVKRSFSFSAGRMAFYAILKTLDIKENDEVIIPAFTCVVVPNAVIYTGAKPVYCDIETDRFGPDPESIRSRITPRTKAIIAQHTFGIPCYIDEIMKVASEFGIPVIEDCAHSLGAMYKGRMLGAIGYASFFSTDHTKIVSTSIGGMAASNDDGCIMRLKKIYENSGFLTSNQIRNQIFSFGLLHALSHPRVYWISRYILAFLIRTRMAMYITDYLALAKPTKYPFPARLSNVHAKIGISQLKQLTDNITHRRNVVEKFEHILAANEHIFQDEDISCAWLRYPFLVKNRDDFTRTFKKYHSLGIWFTQVTQCRNKRFDEVGYESGSCPKAEETTGRIVSIPTHFRMKRLESLYTAMSRLKRIKSNLYSYERGRI